MCPHEEPIPGSGAPPSSTDDNQEIVRLTIVVTGEVQKVGFRDYVRTRGRRMGLVGTATNLTDGRVEIVAEGPRAACGDLLELVRSGHTPGHTVAVSERWSAALGGMSRFTRH
jgi:acylphosphatase